MLITWSDSFKVGIAELDAQHQQLISLLNQLHEALAEGKSEILSQLLFALADYAAKHFDGEEKLMELHAFPDLEKHRARHQEFVSRVVGYQAMYDLEMDSGILLQDILSFLGNWLRDHIMTLDKAAGSFFAERGVK